VASVVRQYTDPVRMQAHARRVAMSIGRTLELALLVEHGQADLDAGDPSTAAAAIRFATTPIDLSSDVRDEDSRALLG
jgi:hypothetical protein